MLKEKFNMLFARAGCEDDRHIRLRWWLFSFIYFIRVVAVVYLKIICQIKKIADLKDWEMSVHDDQIVHYSRVYFREVWEQHNHQQHFHHRLFRQRLQHHVIIWSFIPGNNFFLSLNSDWSLLVTWVRIWIMKSVSKNWSKIHLKRTQLNFRFSLTNSLGTSSQTAKSVSKDSSVI